MSFHVGKRFVLVLAVCVLAGATAGYFLYRHLGKGALNPAPASSVVALQLDPDNEPDALAYADLVLQLGPLKKPSKPYRVGVVMKFFGNQYWQLLAEGMRNEALDRGVLLTIQAGQGENDPDGQRQRMESMLEQAFHAYVISPQTPTNLVKPVYEARQKGVPILNVNESGREGVEHFLGPRQKEAGALAAGYFIARFPEGGKVAVLKGLKGGYAAEQRSLGFREALEGKPFEVVAEPEADWDLQKAMGKANDILARHPDLLGFYCNNDTMALGAAQAALRLSTQGKKYVVIGTDGIEPAYDAIRAGTVTGTVDSHPARMGRIAVELTLRMIEGQRLPRVIYSPQELITLENIDERGE